MSVIRENTDKYFAPLSKWGDSLLWRAIFTGTGSYGSVTASAELTENTQNVGGYNYNIAIGDNKTGIEAFCDLVLGGITPMVNDIVSCQLTNINYETGLCKAKITRIIRRAKD